MLWLKTYLQKEFQIQIWIAAMLVGSIQMLFILGTILITSDPKLIDVGTFGLLLIIFTSVGFMMYKGYITKVPLIFPIVLLLIELGSFFQYGGSKGTIDFNLLAVSVFFVSVTTKKWRYWGIVFLTILIIWATIDTQLHGWMTTLLHERTTTSLNNYIFSLLAIVAYIACYKMVLIHENKRLNKLKSTLEQRHEEIKIQKEKLLAQQDMLIRSNDDIEQIIQKKTQRLHSQNQAIEEYISLSTKALHKPLNELLDEASKTSFEGPLEEQLNLSILELNEVVHKLKKDLTINE